MGLDYNVVDDADALSHAVAERIGRLLEEALYDRERAAVAFSGGSTPAAMLRLLASGPVPWERVDVFQVDERVAPDGSAERNATMLQRSLLDRVDARVAFMPVTDEDLDAAAAAYARLLDERCGGVLDVIHLGLGADGHTASLFPGDPATDIVDRDVAVTGPYDDLRRMTLTYPAINRGRFVVWQVDGADKAGAVRQLVDGDDIPAARVATESATLFVTARAATELR